MKSHTMHCPLETLSPWQKSRGSAHGFYRFKSLGKPVCEGKIGGEGKILMVFCNEFSLCTIFTGDSMLEIPHSWFWGSRGLAPGSSGFSHFTQENPFKRVRSGVDSHRSLRSSTERLLKSPRVNLKSAGERSFHFAAPAVWNSLPNNLRNIHNFASSVQKAT